MLDHFQNDPVTFNPPDFSRYAQTLPVLLFSTGCHQYLSITFQFLPCNRLFGQRMIPTTDQPKRNPSYCPKSKIDRRCGLLPHYAKIRRTGLHHMADIFHEREQKFQFHMRKTGCKILKNRSKRIFRIQLVNSDNQTVFHAFFQRARHTDKMLTPIQNNARFLKQSLTGWRQNRHTPFPAEQQDSEVIFQIADMRADR